MAKVTMKQLLEAGVHFGHRTRRWNPKMRPYIFTERSGIHIIDLQQTMLRLNDYYDMIRDHVADGGTVLFVGTKRQAQATVQKEAERSGSPFVNQRWLGGTLTNWQTIKQRIDYLLRLERRVDAGEFRNLSKKEQLEIDREIERLNRRLGGLKTLKDLPGMVFVVDSNMEDLPVKEANKLKIPLIGMVDTNCDPDDVDYVIPSNDDAIRSVKLIVSVIADAVEEGKRIREVDLADTGQVSDADLAEMEQYLGPSTLAKLQGGEEEEAAAEEVAAAVAAEEVAEAVAEEAVAEAVAEEVVEEAAEEEVAEAVAEEVVEEAVAEEVAEEIIAEAVVEEVADEIVADEIVEEAVAEEVAEEIAEIVAAEEVVAEEVAAEESAEAEEEA